MLNLSPTSLQKQPRAVLLAIAEAKRRGIDLGEELARVKSTGPLWTPFPGPQTLAYHSLADELFYGGAAGGGKTSLLVGLAATAHRKSIIFRREYPQLKDVVNYANEVIGDRGQFNGQLNTWRNIDGKRMLELGAVQHDKDKSRFKGRPHDLKSFDELPDIPESIYRFLIAWNRTTVPGQRCRVVGAGNPPTEAEGEWIIRYWGPWLDSQHPNPAEPGELRWFAVVDGEDKEREDGVPFDWKGEILTPRSRSFIPARVEDNPALMAAGYKATLQNIPEPLRSQLLYGDFRVGIGDNPWQCIPTEWVRMAIQRGKERPDPTDELSCIGVDVARGGADKTVLAKRYGNWFAPLIRKPGTETKDGPTVANLVVMHMTPESSVHVDVIGIGASAYDFLRAWGIPARGINFSEGSKARDRSRRLPFVNRRAEVYWRMREALDPANGEEIALPDDRELLSDLCAPRWGIRTRGIFIESKDDIKERLGRSTDAGDAVVLANYHGMDLEGGEASMFSMPPEVLSQPPAHTPLPSQDSGGLFIPPARETRKRRF